MGLGDIKILNTDGVDMTPVPERRYKSRKQQIKELQGEMPEGFTLAGFAEANMGAVGAKIKALQDDREAQIKKLKVVHVAAKRYLSFFTRYFFKHQYQKKFIVSNHHKLIWAALERVLAGQCTKLIINIPPRYGKTEIAVKNFIAHGLALNPSAKFLHLSYSKALALDNSDAVRDILKSKEFRDLYPDVAIKAKSDAKEKWSTTAGGGVYATATGGQVTGFGAGEVDEEYDSELGGFLDGLDNIGDTDIYGDKAAFAGALIIDDPIKPTEADSDLIRERVNERFDSTLRNRVNSRRTPIIIIMQRLHENDLCGHVLAGEDGEDWDVLSLPAIVDEGTDNEHALWEHKHDLVELYRQRELNKVVFDRQMMQHPMPKEGMMYDSFREYTVIPVTIRSLRKSYTDTADTGKDFLCDIDYVETDEGMYVTNVYYDDAGMETTEPTSARNKSMFNTQVARVEYNNGGGGWRRSVERQCRIMKNHKTKFIGFTQTRNKEVRIFQESGKVTNLIFMPVDWDKKWPRFYLAVTQYSKTGKNLHDDAPDCLTGMIEWFGKDRLQEDQNWKSAF